MRSPFFLFFFAFFSLLLFLSSCQTKRPVVRAPFPEQKVAEVTKSPEEIEFESLMKEDSIRKHQTAAESLDILLNGNANGSKISLIVYNDSKCNMILRLKGPEERSLPIYAEKMNFIVLDRGVYALRGQLCRAKYAATKIFNDSQTIRIFE